MTLELNDLFTIMHRMGPLQWDQVESLIEGSSDQDDYNPNALRHIRRVLIFLSAYEEIDVWGDIAHVDTLLEANE